MAKILILDDSEEMVAVIEQVLLDAGYDVLASCSSQDGLELLRRESVDLAILDVYMPDVDGLEILRLAKQEQLKTRFIVISGMPWPRNMFPVARHHGALFTLQKPLTAEQLLESVGAALNSAHGCATGSSVA